MSKHALRKVDDRFLHEAPLVIEASVDLPATRDEVWEIMGGDRMWSWLPAIDQLHWITPEPRATGCLRKLRIARFLEVEEEFYRWEPNERATFRVIWQSHGVVSALIEDFVLSDCALGTRLTWTMAVEPRRGKRLPLGLLAPLLRPGNRAALAGFAKMFSSSKRA